MVIFTLCDTVHRILLICALSTYVEIIYAAVPKKRWKATHIKEYPIRIDINSKTTEEKETRSVFRNDIKITGISSTSKKSFIVSADEVWNKASYNKGGRQIVFVKKRNF